MTTVGAYEAKTHLPRLLDHVARGGTVVITRHGREVARLVPAATPAQEVATVIDALRAERSGVTLGDISIRELIEEGRR